MTNEGHTPGFHSGSKSNVALVACVAQSHVMWTWPLAQLVDEWRSNADSYWYI
jgi:hypothetical protein